RLCQGGSPRMDGTREERIRAARSAVEAHPDDLPARIRLAATLLESGDPDAALEQFAIALNSDPANLEALEGAADAAAAAGEASRAEGYRRLADALRRTADPPISPPAGRPDPAAPPDAPSESGLEAGVGFLRGPRLRVAHRGEPVAEDWKA